MPDQEHTRVVRIGKLTDKLRELAAQQYEILDEISALTSGEPGVADKLKVLEATFDRVWCARYAPGQHGRYVWSYVRDRPQMKRLLRSLSVEQIEGRMLAYLRNNDDFFHKSRHTFAVFVASVNQHTPEVDTDFALDADAPTVADCRHTPPCASDQAHTAKKIAEMRR